MKITPELIDDLRAKIVHHPVREMDASLVLFGTACSPNLALALMGEVEKLRWAVETLAWRPKIQVPYAEVSENGAFRLRVKHPGRVESYMAIRKAALEAVVMKDLYVESYI